MLKVIMKNFTNGLIISVQYNVVLLSSDNAAVPDSESDDGNKSDAFTDTIQVYHEHPQHDPDIVDPQIPCPSNEQAQETDQRLDESRDEFVL